MMGETGLFCLVLLGSCYARHSRQLIALEAAPVAPGVDPNASFGPEAPDPVGAGQAAAGQASVPVEPASAPAGLPALAPRSKIKPLDLMDSPSSPNRSIEKFGRTLEAIDPGFPNGTNVSKKEEETVLKRNEKGEPIRVITSTRNDGKPQVRTEVVNPTRRIPLPSVARGGDSEDDMGRSDSNGNDDDTDSL